MPRHSASVGELWGLWARRAALALVVLSVRVLVGHKRHRVWRPLEPVRASRSTHAIAWG